MCYKDGKQRHTSRRFPRSGPPDYILGADKRTHLRVGQLKRRPNILRYHLGFGRRLRDSLEFLDNGSIDQLFHGAPENDHIKPGLLAMPRGR